MYANRCTQLCYALLCAAALGTAWPVMGVAGGHPGNPIKVPLPFKAPDLDVKRAWKTAAGTALLNWVNRTGDNMALPFMVIDKTTATVNVYDKHGGMLGTEPVLIGLAIGDDSTPGIGNKRMKDIRPTERTTPAGRFPSALGHNLAGVEILWIDYDNAVSMHPLVTSHAEERRAQRLASPSPTDNRISYGCINVSAAFFREMVAPVFRAHGGIVYVLPEIRSLSETFGLQWPDGQAVETQGGR